MIWFGAILFALVAQFVVVVSLVRQGERERNAHREEVRALMQQRGVPVPLLAPAPAAPRPAPPPMVYDPDGYNHVVVGPADEE